MDFGSQYTPLIARRIRDAGVYSEIVSSEADSTVLQSLNARGIVLSGSEAGVHDTNAPELPPWVLDAGIPILGICYGMQLVTHKLGGTVGKAEHREYGPATLNLIDQTHPLFRKCELVSQAWMSHADKVLKPPPGFQRIAETEGSEWAAVSRNEITLLQFHPEVSNTKFGNIILRNFAVEICGITPNWNMTTFINDTVAEIQSLVGRKHALLGISGGVDSGVAAALVSKAIGEQLHCMFVDTGLLRAGEVQEVEQTLRNFPGLDLTTVRSKTRFLRKLRTVTDPERKRHIIGDEFFAVFIEEAKKLDDIQFFIQGTIYPDRIESGAAGLKSAKIKTHHNTRIPDTLSLDVIEPLRRLFKDEVRQVGLELGLPKSIIWRQPFPGPGLAVRIIGAITEERIATLQAADRILRQEILDAKLESEISQYFAILTGLRTVGVMGDGRTYGEVVGLRAVSSEDFMTADWYRIPDDVLARISSRIVNEVPTITRVVYDITSKPPGTIEWE
jgi:GMP synthase (glutamine-hydrolysing)